MCCVLQPAVRHALVSPPCRRTYTVRATTTTSQTSHVLPALIRKMHEAKRAPGGRGAPVWGTGTPRREFLYSDDLADACVFLMNLPEAQFQSLLCGTAAHAPLINIGCGEDHAIHELAEMVREVIGYGGEVTWDAEKPDGTPRKLLDVTRLTRLGWHASMPLKEGIARAFSDYLHHSATPG